MGLLEKAGAGPLWGGRVLDLMTGAGLTDVTATTYAEAWRGGGDGIALHRHNVDQVADELNGAGVSDGDLRRFRALLEDPAFVVNSYPLIGVCGRKGGAA
ncbi:hypothetical protein AB0L99_08775 [Streptomyces sp. NPDC051954]|uniref:hypothetical protein n=1 Tax=Streptomyces sp. NPDC051954 TaxID=3155524 RepID=UPI00341ED30B